MAAERPSRHKRRALVEIGEVPTWDVNEGGTTEPPFNVQSSLYLGDVMAQCARGRQATDFMVFPKELFPQ